MIQAELHVQLRAETGKGAGRRLRAQGQVPAVFYGPRSKEAVCLAVGAKELTRVARMGSNALLTLRAEGHPDVNGKLVLLKDEMLDPVTQKRVHVDFYEVSLDEEIRIDVPVILIGKAKGVAEGGILQQVHRHLEVFCLPKNIPERIEVDVTPLDVGQSLHVSDIALSQGIKVATKVDYTLAALVPPEKEPVAEVPVEAVPVEGEVPEGEAPAEGAPAEGDKAEPEKGEKKAPEEKKSKGK